MGEMREKLLTGRDAPAMTALVVYESMWGNTARIAQAIARGMGGANVAEVSNASLADVRGLHLLVVGGPTHAFSMTRATTRQDAHRQGAPRGDEERGIRELLAELPADLDVPVATFDTRMAKVRRLPGSAGKAAEKELRSHHRARVVGRESFYVEDSAGPLLPGEVERAEAWGAHLAAADTS
jgi:hypothetical protein